MKAITPALKKKALAAKSEAEAEMTAEERLKAEIKRSEAHRRNLALALEDYFAASLPSVMKRSYGMDIAPQNVKTRVRKKNHSLEIDFIAPNGKVALVGEVKTRLKAKDVLAFIGLLTAQFREEFPEYSGMEVWGVVGGGVIDPDAADIARKSGLIVLRLEGGVELHPAVAAKKFKPTAY